MLSFHFFLYGGKDGESNLPLPTSFDAAYSRLESMAGVYIEPDGSFAWTDLPQRIEGQMFDQGDALNSVELRGNCVPSSLAMLAEVFGYPQASLVLQCNQSGRIMGLSELLASG